MSIIQTIDRGIVVTCSNDSSIKLWDSQNYDPIATLKGHKSAILTTAIATNIKSIFSAGGFQDRIIRKWDIQCLYCTQTYVGHKLTISNLEYCEKSNILLSAAYDQEIRLWNVETAECLKILSGNGAWILSIQYIPELDQLISLSKNGKTLYWKLNLKDNGQSKLLTTVQNSTQKTLKYLEKSKEIIMVGQSPIIKVSCILTNKNIKLLSGHTEEIPNIDINKKHKLIISGSCDRYSNIWNYNNKKCLKRIYIEDHFITALNIYKSKPQVIAGFCCGKMKIFNYLNGASPHYVDAHLLPINNITYFSINYPIRGQCPNSSDNELEKECLIQNEFNTQ